eukprot:4983410-Pleurochrysis_carterae.AAC.1
MNNLRHIIDVNELNLPFKIKLAVLLIHDMCSQICRAVCTCPSKAVTARGLGARARVAARVGGGHGVVCTSVVASVLALPPFAGFWQCVQY